MTLTAGGTSLTTLINANHIAPAGTSGEAISLALTEPAADHAGPVSVTVGGVPAGWTLSEGTHNTDGSWTVQTNDSASLSITSPDGYTGALVLQVTESWTDSDGAMRTTPSSPTTSKPMPRARRSSPGPATIP